MTERVANKVADVLDKAADELLIRGWCQEHIETADGRVCGLGSIARVLNLRETDGTLAYPQYDSFGGECVRALLDVLPADEKSWRSGSLVFLRWTTWQDAEGRTIDDVLDAFRMASKKARG